MYGSASGAALGTTSSARCRRRCAGRSVWRSAYWIKRLNVKAKGNNKFISDLTRLEGFSGQVKTRLERSEVHVYTELSPASRSLSTSTREKHFARRTQRRTLHLSHRMYLPRPRHSNGENAFCRRTNFHSHFSAPLGDCMCPDTALACAPLFVCNVISAINFQYLLISPSAMLLWVVSRLIFFQRNESQLNRVPMGEWWGRFEEERVEKSWSDF